MRTQLASLALLLGFAATARADPQNPTKAERDRAHELFMQSKKLDCAKASPLLEEAWALHHSADIAANLGMCEAEASKYPEAATHLAFADAHIMASATKDQREKVSNALALVKKQVGEVMLSVQPDGAAISVDGNPVGISPLPAPLFLPPGDHQVRATADGYGDVGRIVTAKKGERTEVAIELLLLSASGTGGTTAGTGGAPSGAGGTPSGGGDAGAGGDTAPTTERSMVPVYVAGGVAVVGVASAIGFELARSSNADDASKLADVLGPNGCGAGTPHATECAQLHDSNVAANRDSNLRNVSVGIAGAGIVFGIAYLVWPRTSSAEPSAKRQTLTATPIVSPKSTGVWLSGSF